MSLFSASTLVPSTTDVGSNKAVESYVSRLVGQTPLFKATQRTIEEVFGNVSANTVSSKSLESISLSNRTFISFQLYRFLDLMSAEEKNEVIENSTNLIEKHFYERVEKYNAYNEKHKDNASVKTKHCRSYRYMVATDKDLSCRAEAQLLGSFKFNNITLYVVKYRRPVKKFRSMATVEDVKRENKIEIFEQGRNVLSQYSRFPTAFPSHLLG